MKSRFSTIDLAVAIAELQSVLHMRVVNVYDIDQKTYLFKLAKPDDKCVLLVESGSRIHRTDYEWPKNVSPSGFTMKLRKHIHNRRLEEIRQLGNDRIVDLKFGCNEAAYHVIIELYDRGNILLTDHEYVILNVLRRRTENEMVKFAVHERYDIERPKRKQELISVDRLREIFATAKIGDGLRKVLNPHLDYGPALIDHVLLGANFPENAKIGKEFKIDQDVEQLVTALEEAEKILISYMQGDFKGYITQKTEKKAKKDERDEVLLVYNEFHPILFRQHEKMPYVEFSSFNKAVDEFFSKLESQKLDLKAIQQEKEAVKKLDNVRKDHEHRLEMLQKNQEKDTFKAQLIEMNLELVEKAIRTVQSAIANQLDWKEISALIQEATQQGDRVARAIKVLKLEINNITMLLEAPNYDDYDDEDDEDDTEKQTNALVDIDLDLTAYANAKKYYDKKKDALKKEQKTVASSGKALKSAERKMKQTLKEVATVASINKARKTHWFEKFLWFISSENYLVIGGRDQQQNEIVVKRYLRPGDVYVHADLHGASSIVIKNPSGKEIPPKTLNEAGTIAVCSSAAWASKVVTSAWWVHRDQVSKTAPTGEYLTTGSFMIRGKKNYLPPCYLIMGFGFLFRLDDESIPNHADERKVRIFDENLAASESVDEETEDVEINLDDDSESDQDGEDGENSNHVEENQNDDSKKLRKIDEEDENVENDNAEFLGDADENTDGQTVAFPDTIIDLEHVQGDRFIIKPRTTTSNNDDVIYLGDNQPVIIKSSANKRQDKHSGASKSSTGNENKAEPANKEKNINPGQLKRGQRYKLKKIKTKYKDEDEEDKALAMLLLQGPKDKKKNKKSSDRASNKEKNQKDKKPPLSQTRTKNVENDDISKEGASKAEDDISDDETETKQAAEEDARLLNSLTGSPLTEDVLLYAIPVCAPYNAIVNYKYKVKLTPGSGKRGKVAKTSLAMFLHDKTSTAREKDLFRSVKDQDISRNLPGKSKLSAPQLLKKK